MPATLPPSGDPERDRLLEEIFRINDQVHARSVELVGPMDLPHDLTMQQLRVLTRVAREPGITGHELGRRLGVTAPTASGLVERLVEKNLLERVDDPLDRRVRRLRLTEDGARMISGVDATFGKLLTAVIPPIPTERLEVLKAGSQVMLEAIEHALAERERQAGTGVS